MHVFARPCGDQSEPWPIMLVLSTLFACLFVGLVFLGGRVRGGVETTSLTNWNWLVGRAS